MYIPVIDINTIAIQLRFCNIFSNSSYTFQSIQIITRETSMCQEHLVKAYTKW